MKNLIIKLYLQFNKLPNWAAYLIFFSILFCLIGFWNFIIEPRIEWLYDPILYIFEIIISLGIGLFSAFWLVYVAVSKIKKTKFGEIKIKEFPKLFGILFLYFCWVFVTFIFIGGGINVVLDPFGISLQSLGIFPRMYPGYFLDNPVYFFGYKIIPIFD